MAGPSLYKLDAHRSIHDGAFSAGRDLLGLLEKVYHEKQVEEAKEVAEALIEHWETRTIAHAASEEEDFYDKMVEEKPDLAQLVIMLKRDHELFRTIVSDIKEIMTEHGVNNDVIDRFKALSVIVQIHSRDEETHLLA